MSGTLYLCGTPIGNLEDITLRTLRLLKECDLIAAEDTRQTVKILNHYGIEKPMISYHEHNKSTAGIKIIQKLEEGQNICLVTDAGMPGISDPGEDLVRLCYEYGIEVTASPGPVACITALVISGLPTRRFAFEAFLPTDKKERKNILESLKNETRTIILYEAPHRLKETLEELYKYLGDRNVACIRELTKKFEEVKKDSLLNLISYYRENLPKGEFVILIEPKTFKEIKSEEEENYKEMPIEEHLKIYLEKGMSEKDAMKAVAKDRGVSKRDIYNMLKI